MTSATPEPSQRPGSNPEDEREPQIDPEVLKDLDVTEGDDDKIRGGISRSPGCVMG